MYRRFISFFFVSVFLMITGCSASDSTDDVGTKAAVANMEMEECDIFNMLADYPALEGFFTSGGLSRAVFEDKLYRRILGNDYYADTVVDTLEALPHLFEARTIEGVLPEDILSEMNERGPLPDLISAVASMVENTLSLPDEQRLPLYSYLDSLDEIENLPTESLESFDYIREIIFLTIRRQSQLDNQTINDIMDIKVSEMNESRVSRDGSLDFFDIDEKLLEISIEAPGGPALVLRGLKPLLYEPETLECLRRILSGRGASLDNPDLFRTEKNVLCSIEKSHDDTSLGELIERIWTKGPVIGPGLTRIGIEGYGKDGSQQHNARQLLCHPEITSSFIEYISLFDRQGYRLDGNAAAQRLKEMIEFDPHLTDRASDGRKYIGEENSFYQPDDKTNFRDISFFRAFVRFGSRFHTALTLTSPLLWENEDSEKTLKLIRTLIPSADSMPVSSLLWSPMFEKNPGSFIGKGKPVEVKKDYGVLMDYDEALGGEAYSGFDGRVWVAPGCSGTMTGAETAFLSIVDTIENGPYDNIWDNANYMLYERDIFLVMDLVDVLERIAIIGSFLDSAVGRIMENVISALTGSDFSSIPLVLLKVDGINGMIHTELGVVKDELHDNIARGIKYVDIPASLKNTILGLFGNESVRDALGEILIDAFGKPETDATGNTKWYMYPQDLRDTWPVILAGLGYFDPDAFDPKKFMNRQDPENYSKSYDTSGYRYDTHSEYASPLLPLIAAIALSSRHMYDEVTEQYSYADAAPRAEAAMDAFGCAFPMSYILNMLIPLVEMPIERHFYAEGGMDLPLTEAIEPLMLETLEGEMMQGIFDMLVIMGGDDMETARRNIFSGLSSIVSTIDPDSNSPRTIAHDFLDTPRKAAIDPRYWTAMEAGIAIEADLLDQDSPFCIIDTIIELLEHLTDVQIADDEWAMASRGITDLIGMNAGDDFHARLMIDMTDIMTYMNSVHVWGRSLDMAGATLEPDGAMSYLLLGMERDTAYSWDEILRDTSRFLRSDTMMAVGEGSFWKDLYYLVKFMSEAME